MPAAGRAARRRCSRSCRPVPGRRRARRGSRCPPSGPCGRRRGRRRRWRSGGPRPGRCRASQRVTKVAPKQSPAPVGSTSSTAKAGAARAMPGAWKLAPSAPFLTTTARMPRARSSAAASASPVAAVKRKSSGPDGQEEVGDREDAVHASRGCRAVREDRARRFGSKETVPPLALDAVGGGEGEVDDRRRRERGAHDVEVVGAVDQRARPRGSRRCAPAALWRMLKTKSRLPSAR